MKSPIYLLRLILTECGDRCRVSTDRDWKTASERFKHEGYSFLAITLNDYSKDFHKALDQGHLSPDMFGSFTKRAGLPEFLRGFLENVFDPSDGTLRSSPCVECIRSIRQISMMWAKKKEMPSDRRVQLAFNQFKECESDVRTGSRGLFLEDRERQLGERTSSRLFDFQRMSKLVFSRDFSIANRKIASGEVYPSHGPGAVAERFRQNQKFSAATWTERLEGLFPYGRYALSSFRFQMESAVRYLDPGSETPVRVVAVPKTVSTPRIIAIEPVAHQYVQQGLKRVFEENLENTRHLASNAFSNREAGSRVSWTPGDFIRYSSQLPNQEMARRGSEISDLATLDLREASDRVPNLLVHNLFRGFPLLGEAVQACRSTRADVPGVGIIPLSKFASMGSALTFPIESMVFLVIVFVGIEKALGVPLTNDLIKSFVGHVRIYGDDIIVPVEFTHPVIDALESYGLLVNRHKSFWTGKFRESCGKDYYDGEDVTIVRLRRDIPTDRQQAQNLVAFVEFRNQLYKAGYWRTVHFLDRQIEGLIPFPAMTEGSQGLGKVSFLGYESHKWDSRLQRPLVRAAVPVFKERSDALDGHWALMKFFVNKFRSSRPVFNREHLVHAGRPTVVGIKQQWIHPDYGMDGD